MMMHTLLANADFVIQRKGAFLRRASVCIRDHCIEAVGDATELDRRFPGASRIDCSGCILLPGLINAHSHLYQILLRGLGKRYSLFDWITRLTYPVARQLTAPAHDVAARLACLDAFRNGITAVVDMPTHYARFHASTVFRALQEAGIRGAVVCAGSDASSVDPGETRSLEQDLQAAAAFLDRHQGSGVLQAWLGPSGFHSASPDLLRRMKRLAVDRGVRFHVHLGESARGRDCARARGYAGEVAWAHSLGLLDAHTSVAHGIWVSEAEAEAFCRSGAQLVHNPTSNQVLASGVADIGRMRTMGIPLALGSDGPASNDALDMFGEMKAAILLQRVSTLDPLALTAADAFEMCTEGGARVLGIKNLGCIDTGYLADVVAVRARDNPSLTPIYDPIESLVYHGSGRDVVLTMVHGRIVYRWGAFLTLDSAEIFSRVGQIHDDIARIVA
jgi:5-methylthioadenosine/S-adenosylhomocysteine deaminase